MLNRKKSWIIMSKKVLLFSLGFFLGCSLISILALHYKLQVNELKKPASIIGFTKIDPSTKKPYPIIENKRFVVVIPSYNNELYYERNLLSVFEQKYENYRVIYIDDCSTDHTYENVKKLIEKTNQSNRVTLIHNEKRQGGLFNLYKAIHSCIDDEIIVTLDGDDWFSKPDVLNILNDYYANPNIWIAWSNHISIPNYRLPSNGPFYKRELQKKDFRHLFWRTSQLRTFYAGLFKKIPLEDFLYDGNWYSTAWDFAFMFPMIEMANPHFAFIPEILYIYNQLTPYNEDQTNLKKIALSANHICSLPPKKPIKHWSNNELSKSRTSSSPFVSGDSFRFSANFVYDELKKDKIIDKIQDNNTIFVKGNLLKEFFTLIHPKIPCSYILISHNSDTNITSEYLPYLEDNKLTCWFTQNMECHHPKLIPIPIGLANQCWPHGNTKILSQKQKIKNFKKKRFLYLNFNLETSLQERKNVYNFFKNKSFSYVQNAKSFPKYLDDLSTVQFVLSPRGNGLDCHRTWEALYMGAIPIIKTSPLDPLYKDLPVVIVQDWSEITKEFLEKKYEEFSQKKFSMEKLYFPYWKDQIEKIKQQQK